jgi:hypothetical protein
LDERRGAAFEAEGCVFFSLPLVIAFFWRSSTTS